MSFFMAISISIMAGLSTLLGTLPIFIKWKETQIEKFITFSLSLSIVIMIGISIIELIPEASYTILSEYKIIKGSIISISLFILSIIIIEILHKKIEKGSRLYQIGILSMLTLMIHNMPEGIITFYSANYSLKLGIKMGLSIMLHNISEGICIAMPIYFGTRSKKKAILYTLLSGLSEPLGAILTFFIFKDIVSEIVIAYILIITAGFMITLSIEHMLPKALEYHQAKYLTLGIIAGIILLFITNMFIK